MKNLIFCLIISYLSVCPLHSLAQNNSRGLKDEQVIRKLVEQENAGKLVPSFTKDRILVTGLYPQPIVGVISVEQDTKPEASAKTRGKPKKRRVVLRLVVSEAGDIAYEFGNYSSASGNKGSRNNNSGSYLRTWKKIGGSWLVDVLFERPS